MIKNPVKFGIVGCGNHATHHATLAGGSGLQLVAVFDTNREAMEKLKKACGDPSIILCNSFEELLEMDIDAVMDCSPEQFHLSNLHSIISNSKHAFIEKPMATSIEEIEELMKLLKIARDKNLVVTSCHIRRFDPPYMWMEDNLGYFVCKLGKIISVDMDFSYHIPSASWKRGRSLLSDHANHEIDFINYLLGYDNFTAHKLFDSFDRYELCGKRHDGVTFKFQGTRCLNNRLFTETVKLRFERGEVLVDTKRGIASVIDHDADYFENDSSTPLDPDVIIIGKTDYDKRLIGVMINFVKCIKGTRNNYLTKEDLFVNNYLCVVLEKKNKVKVEL